MKFKIALITILMLFVLMLIREFSDRTIGNVTIHSSYGYTPAFNYMLSGYDQNHTSFGEYLVNDYLIYDGYLYYTYISSGAGLDGWCFFDDRLMLSRVNIRNNHLETDINSTVFNEIYQQINDISPNDKAWLSNMQNKCK